MRFPSKKIPVCHISFMISRSSRAKAVDVGRDISGLSAYEQYINKKSQGTPGSKTIWRGMARFDTVVEAFAAFNQMTCGV